MLASDGGTGDEDEADPSPPPACADGRDNDDDEHTEFAWLITRALWGDLQDDLLDLVRLDPFYRIFWSGEEQHLDFVADRDQMKGEIAKFSQRDAQRFDGFMDAMRPIYEEGILGAGRREFSSIGQLARFAPRMVKLGAALPLWNAVARHFENPRIREAFSFHSLFIGGDPFRVPAIYGALVYLQFLDGVWYSDGGVYALVEAMAAATAVVATKTEGAQEVVEDQITGLLAPIGNVDESGHSTAGALLASHSARLRCANGSGEPGRVESAL